VITRTGRTGAFVALLLTAIILALVVARGGAVSSSIQTTASTPSASPSPSGSPVASPVPAECLASADGIVLPVPSNPITNTSTAPGLTIVEVLVENNVDPATGGDAPDHLEIKLRNDSGSELTGFVVYYEITDLVTGAKEGYCSELAGFTIPAGGERNVHFDNSGAPDHFPDNEFSLYHSSLNEMQVDVTVSATGVALQTASVMKEAGGDENPDE
jgi:hypothetical protein